MTNRWKKRSMDEKQKILEKIEIPQGKGNYKDYFDSKPIMDILGKSELPLYCKKCGWTTSQYYILSKSTGPFGDLDIGTGTCITCGCPVHSPFRGIAVSLDMKMLYGLVIVNLISKNRLIDNRNKGEIGDIESFHIDERQG